MVKAQKILPLIEEVARAPQTRFTGEMNRFLKTIDFDRASVPVSKRVRIYYDAGCGCTPLLFLFTDRQ
jgi:GTP-binding protein